MFIDVNEKEFIPPSARIVFIDLDDTITDTKTDWLWAVWRAGHSLIGLVEMAWLITMYVGYNRGTLTGDRLLRYHRFRVGSIEPMAFRAMALKFFIEKGEQHIYKDAFRLVRAHKELGSRVVMLTAQHDLIAGPFVQRLDMDDLVANHLNAGGARFGEPIKPFCYQEGKIYWAEQFAQNSKTSLKECAFYSDSINDLPLLKLVGYPVVINPDIYIEEIAQAERWPILRFSSKK